MVADEVMSTINAYGPEEYTQVLRSRGRASEPFERFAYEVDIDTDPALVAEFNDEVPVTFVDGRRHDFWRVSEDRLRTALAR